MAKGDRLEATAGDEIEIAFQLSYKQAEVAKRKDAGRLTHVTVEFIPDAVGPNGGKITVEPLSGDAPSGATEAIPVTADDPTLVRLYRLGPIEATEGGASVPSTLDLRVFARLIPDPNGNDHERAGVPRDAELGRIRVHQPKAP